MLFKKTPALSYQFPLIVACPLQLPKPKVKSVFPFESKVRSTFIPVLLLMPMHPSQQILPPMVKLPQPTKENAPVEVAYFPFKPSSALASAPNFVQVIDAPFKNACANTIAPMPYSFPPDAKSIHNLASKPAWAPKEALITPRSIL